MIDVTQRLTALEQRVADVEGKYSALKTEFDRHVCNTKREESPSIMSADLSIRAKHVCESAGIWTFEELHDYTSARLLRQRNCGLKTIEELRDALVKAGFSAVW